MNFFNDKVVYKGGFNNGYCDGTGELRFVESGNLLKGEFNKNMKHGEAEFIVNNSNLKYTGKFADNVEVISKQNFGKRL